MENKNKNFVYKNLVSPPPRTGLPDNVCIAGVPFGGHKFKNKTAEKWLRKLHNRARAKALRREETAILDSGAMGTYLTPEAPTKSMDPSAPQIRVGTASGQPHRSRAAAELHVPTPAGTPPFQGHVMPPFKHNLMGVGDFCDRDCEVHFSKEAVVVYDPNMDPLIAGWREELRPGQSGKRLWRVSLRPEEDLIPEELSVRGEAYKGAGYRARKVEKADLEAFSAYDLPSVEALVKYFHAAAGYPVKDT